jgi:hypothetical protein
VLIGGSTSSPTTKAKLHILAFPASSAARTQACYKLILGVSDMKARISEKSILGLGAEDGWKL